MFTTLLSLLKSDGVNEFGDLATVLEGLYSPLYRMEPSTPYKQIISAAVLNKKRPICLIPIDKNKPPDMLKLYFIPNTEIDWKETIYLVSIFGQYAMINNPKTPEKIIKMFERMFDQIKRDFPDRKDVVQPVETELSFLMENLDNDDEFKSIDAFMKSFKSPSVQSKPSTSRKIRFENNYPSGIKQSTPKSSTISKRSNGSYYIKHSNGTRSKLPGILKTRKNNGSVHAPTPRTSPINNSPPPRTNKPTYMDWLFPKNPKKKTARILGPGPAMREIIRRTHKGWEKKES
jgi:hypothetical protein